MSPIQSSQTLDSCHKKRISHIHEQIDRINSRIRKIHEDDNMSMEEEKTLESLKLEKEKFVKQETNYYLTVMDLLTAYYGDSCAAAAASVNKGVNNHKTTTTTTTTKSKPSITTITEESDLRDFLGKQIKINKTRLFNEYMFRLNNETKNKKILYTDLRHVCEDCKSTKTLDSLKSSYVCEECGKCLFVLLEPDKSNYVKNPIVENANFSYRRYDHFVQWLNKFHNVDKGKVPRKIYKTVQTELNKFPKDDSITKEMVLRILKKTGNTRYNSQIPQIISGLNNKQLPKLPIDIQYRMKCMFKQTLQPFAEICPDSRTNFLSYSYVIRKFLEILQQRDYLEYFPLLKSKEKLYQQDLIWKGICEKLQWKYNPTI